MCPRTIRAYWMLILLAAVSLEVIGPVWVVAQTAQGRASIPLPRTLLADQILLLSKRCLSGQQEPTGEQLRSASLLMDMALQLDDQDPHKWELKAELARLQGNNQDRAVALGRYCGLRPNDDAAQLDLVMLSLEGLHTVEERISAVERILDSRSASRFSAPLRSRLACYAAEGAKELGNRERAAKRLQSAAELDRSNGRAMRLVYESVVERRGSPVEAAAALAGVIAADPLDAHPRRLLGDLLLDHAAYEQAAELYLAAYTLAQSPPDAMFIHDLIFCLAANGRSGQALAQLSAIEAAMQEAATASGKEAKPGQAAGGSTAGKTDVRLPIDLELLRLAIFERNGQDLSARTSLDSIGRQLQSKIDGGDAQARGDLLWLTSLFSPTPVDAQALESLIKTRGDNDPLVKRIRAYELLKQIGAEGIESSLKSLDAADPFATYGQARLSSRGNKTAVIDHLRGTVDMAPRTLAALLAACDLARGGDSARPTPVGKEIVRIAGGLPAFVRNLDLAQKPWVSLKIQAEEFRFQYLQPIFIKVSIQNTTELPLTVGPDGVIPTRLMIIPSARLGGESVMGIPPVIENLGRRLAIKSQESIDLDVRLDQSELGWLLATQGSHRAVISGAAILDPRGMVSDRMTTGPLGVTISIPNLERVGRTIGASNVDAALAAISSPDISVQMPAIAWLEQIASQLTSPDAQPLATTINDALAKRFSELDPVCQAWTACFLRPDANGKPTMPKLHDLALRSNQPLVRVVYLASQVTQPNSPALDAALRMEDPTVVAFAGSWRAVLEMMRQAEAAAAAKAKPPAAAPPGR